MITSRGAVQHHLRGYPAAHARDKHPAEAHQLQLGIGVYFHRRAHISVSGKL